MALTYVFSGLSKLNLSPMRERSVLRFRLVFRSLPSHQETVQFEIAASDAMKVLQALQHVQTEQGWQNPPPPPRGKPQLRIVSSDESSDEKP